MPLRVALQFTALLLLMLAGCSAFGAETPTPEFGTPAVQPKVLATVYLSPTPDDAEREGTRLAISAVTPTPPPTHTPAPTAYVGVFLGDAGAIDGGVGSPPLAATSPPVIDLPTLGAPNCPYPVDPVYGTAWTTNPAFNLGCAGEPSTTLVGTEQIFEHGVMYWLPSGEIWTIATNEGRYWYVTEAPPDQGWTVPPPAGLQMPQQGFGAVWKAVDGVRQALGFARTGEQSATLAVQRFANGALIHDATAGQTFVLMGGDTGSAAGPY